MASERTDGFGNKHLSMSRDDLQIEYKNQRWENVTLSCFKGAFSRFFFFHRIYFIDDNGRVKVLKDALGPGVSSVPVAYEYRVSWQVDGGSPPNQGAGGCPHEKTAASRARRANRTFRHHPYRR